MAKADIHDVAARFMLRAIQEWGQSEEDRVAAVQALLDAADFKATATGWPIFGGIWKSACTGPDGDAATAWLKLVTDTMKRGEFNSEVRHIEACLRGRKSQAA